MRLHVLGSSGGYPRADNPCSGFLLEGEEARIWIDAGHGTFAPLRGLLDFRQLDAIVLSHIHPDHCVDLFALHVATLWGEGQGLRFPLYAPPDSRETLAALLFEDGLAKFDAAFDFHPIEQGSEIEIGPVRGRFLRTQHPIHTLAMRLETPSGVLTYSADTGPETDLVGLAAGSDLALFEATYQEAYRGAPVHLSATEAGERAQRAGVGRLALTHGWPPLDSRISLEEGTAAAGGIPVSLALPGGVIEIGGNASRPAHQEDQE
jgi:ribonuclease BN (tRNA processing enzyme)